MKKTIVFSLFFAILVSCNKESSDFQALDDNALAVVISGDATRSAVSPETLPAEALANIESDFFDTYVETCYLAPEKGYEVAMATGERLYFNLRGRRLEFRGGPTDGPCGRFVGRIIPVSELRPGIIQYIRENYPGIAVVKAKQRGDKTIVLLRNLTLIVFSPEGIFELAVPAWWDCLSCVPGDDANIPQRVMEMLENRLPGAEIVRACRMNGRIVLGVKYNEGRKILVFDGEWNFLYSHG